ncbi:MAG: hypothetical protein D6706_17250 [Chloroflexi bacterium]|nr:MAG: hypothetical protein D6706_17250 [Chloroflexota bacterium]
MKKGFAGGRWRELEVRGGEVRWMENGRIQLYLPVVRGGYADAQIDDYGETAVSHSFLSRLSRRHYPWQPPLHLQLRARFSHPLHLLQGTAGFGFWNAPFGDPTVLLPTLPRATWFFFASAHSDLPFAPFGRQNQWFAAAMNVLLHRAIWLLPVGPILLLLHQVPRWRNVLWPRVQRFLHIHSTPLVCSLTEWHKYELFWLSDGCRFLVDDELVWKTAVTPQGPLGFVCWIDNQYLRATPDGRFRWGTIPVTQSQWLEIEELTISPL